MKSVITDKLDDIQSEHSIRVLAAREMGSRMMGVPHEDSDYDVMFVYCFEEPWKYVARGHSKQTITVEDDPLDLHGWNIDKFANHYMDSNPTVVAFLNSDVYEETHPFIWRELERDMQENFNHMALYHHYISLATNQYTQYIENGNDVTRGRQFYIMRATAMARYIRVAGEMPPIDTYKFLDKAQSRVLSNEEYDKLMWLADQKTLGAGDKHQPDVVGDFHESEADAEMRPTDERTQSPSEFAINDLIREALTRSEDL